MGNQVGTATNLEDLFGKIVTFLTTNAALVAASQQWQVLYEHRDNLANVFTNMVDNATGGNRKVIQTARYDPRTLNVNDPSSSAGGGHYGLVAFTAGVSFVTYQLRVAKEVKTVRFRATQYAANTQYALRTFRLQYSDDNSAWTTALTVTNTPAFAAGEWRDFAVPGTPGSHVYWRILIDATQAGSNVSWSSLLLLDAGNAVANQFGSEVMFKSTGLAGTDEIYTGMRCEYDTTNGWYNLFWNGYTGYDPLERSWFQQPGALPGAGAPNMQCVPMTPAWDAAMPFWFSASGRSFRLGLKVSTNYESGYIGFGLPYAQPDQYPYPLVVAGCMAPNSLTVRGASWRYSLADYQHGSIAGPGSDHGNGSTDPTDDYATMYIRDTSGVWQYVTNRPTTTISGADTVQRPDQAPTAPYAPSTSAMLRGVWPHVQFSPSQPGSKGRYAYRENLGGGYMLVECVIIQRSPVAGPLCQLEGVFWISGFSNAAENTGTFGGKTHVVFQNAYRNSVHEFFALSLD